MAVLMTGDAEGILRLYHEMVGEEPEPDLSHVWPVRLGEATEQLNLDWFEEKNGLLVTRRGEVVVHPDYPWAAATLDGWVEVPLGYPLEAKHCGGREPVEVLIDRYQPQCQWLCSVTGARQCALSIILGVNPPIVEFIDRDDEYIAEMMRRGQQFMDCVARRIPPVALPAVSWPADATKIVNMTGNNTWAASADDWLKTREASRINIEATSILKAMVPADAKKAHGHGIRITRDRVGRLSLREEDA